MTRKTCIVLSLSSLLGLGLGVAKGFQEEVPPAVPARKVDFQKEIRPIFSDNCYQCHGPDEDKREADLRLDRRESAFRDRGGYRAIVPGQPEESELYLLISSEFPDDRMPPPEAKKTLSAEQVESIRLWIEQGAEWKDHWSFVTPGRPRLPRVSDELWAHHPIDRLVMSRLDQEGLEPSPAADRETQIRRLSLDLTGLPPSLEEVEGFLQDSSPEAYERVVDRLLASSHFGERLALQWLDAARYADSNGYHQDATRSMWLWRDWVIDAFNSNMPYDRFLTEQLAGDLIPGARDSQKIATGFNRNHMINDEGGAIDAEYQVEYVVDRVRTTSTVFMGLTLGCAQCHDHKYDPISQEEYYRFFAFFNRVPEKGVDYSISRQNEFGTYAMAAPALSLPRKEQLAAIVEFEKDVARVRERMNESRPELEKAEEVWASGLSRRLRERWTVLGLTDLEAENGVDLEVLEDGSVLAGGEQPARTTYRAAAQTDQTGITGLWLEVLNDERFNGRPSPSEDGNFVLSEFEVEAVSMKDPAARTAIRFSGASATKLSGRSSIGRAFDGDPRIGWWAGTTRRDRQTVGQNSSAIFIPSEPFGYAGGTRLLFRLQQNDGQKRIIGRFRISVTNVQELNSLRRPAQLSEWSILGPIVGKSDELMSQELWPEKIADPPAASALEDWQPLTEAIDGKIYNLPGADRAYFLRRTIETESARRMELAVGSEDFLVVWINGEEIYRKKNASRTSDLPQCQARPCGLIRQVADDNQARVRVELPRGTSTVLVKVVNHAPTGGLYFDRLVEGPTILSGDLTAALRLEPGERTADQTFQVRDHYRTDRDTAWKQYKEKLADLYKKIAEVRANFPGLMVMEDQPEIRQTRILDRGQYDRPGRIVEAGTPAFLPPLTGEGTRNRLHLAKWLVDPGHPLTARVAVNRLWQMLFGTGLVATPADFGSQGEPPSHPQLLDWLAVEFVESGWDVKAMLRRIVTSNTYRQSSRMTRESIERDPENRLLARGARFRLDAEFIRDYALVASGLLNRKIGGPSVRTYQPDGLWAEVTFRSKSRADADFFTADSDDRLYRRGLYTFWKRTLPPPNLQALDAPTREVCRVSRSRTNTPLQALVLMNDPTFTEAARVMAGRVLLRAVSTRDRLTLAFQLATSRRPDREELDVLGGFLREQLEVYGDDRAAAEELIQVGQAPLEPSLDPVDHAAWAVLCSLLLNLDEAITRG